MASLPGGTITVTGASGTQGLLAPMASWKVYVFPQGGHASQSSTGTLITFDSATVASRFAANNWIQAGLNTSNIRQVSAVGGNSIAIGGAALTIAENDRIFVIGNTQPTVTGGSATYTTPNTIVRQRDDDAADLYTNSMITSDPNGLAQFWAEQNTFDCMIQDSNGSNQGAIIDYTVGNSQSAQSVFGATVTINASLGVTGNVVFANTVSVYGTLGVTGWAFFGSTVTMHAQLGVTSHATFGSTVTGHGNAGFTGFLTVGTTATVAGAALVGGTFTVNGAIGVTGWATFGASVTITGALGVTGSLIVGGTATFGSTIVVSGISSGGLILGSSMSVIGHLTTNRIKMRKGTTHTQANYIVGASWGNGVTTTNVANCRDSAGRLFVLVTNDTNAGNFAPVTMTFADGAWESPPVVITTAGNTMSLLNAQWLVTYVGTTEVSFAMSAGTPVQNNTYVLNYLCIGTS